MGWAKPLHFTLHWKTGWVQFLNTTLQCFQKFHRSKFSIRVLSQIGKDREGIKEHNLAVKNTYKVYCSGMLKVTRSY